MIKNIIYRKEKVNGLVLAIFSAAHFTLGDRRVATYYTKGDWRWRAEHGCLAEEVGEILVGTVENTERIV